MDSVEEAKHNKHPRLPSVVPPCRKHCAARVQLHFSHALGRVTPVVGEVDRGSCNTLIACTQLAVTTQPSCRQQLLRVGGPDTLAVAIYPVASATRVHAVVYPIQKRNDTSRVSPVRDSAWPLL